MVTTVNSVPQSEPEATEAPAPNRESRLDARWHRVARELPGPTAGVLRSAIGPAREIGTTRRRRRPRRDVGLSTVPAMRMTEHPEGVHHG